ncbi:MAG: methanethiol S-methyltransferase [Chloroflexota bacterium]
MKRLFILLYGILGYMIGMGGLTYFILFVGGWDFLPFHIDSGAPDTLSSAFLINIGLITLFGLQHSVMARPSFKKAWTRIIPKSAERSTYVLISGVTMILICYFWQPVPGFLWKVENPVGWSLLTTGYGLGWVLAVVATFLINHFDLFGLQQVYLNLRNKPEPAPAFTETFLYRMVRHPLQLGILIGIWVAPTMSISHLILSVGMTTYIFIGLYFEEKDLVASLGKEYQAYQKRVPKILPLPRPSVEPAFRATADLAVEPAIAEPEFVFTRSISGD